jgi:enoyl-CoA hydratase/carnithine racemase
MSYVHLLVAGDGPITTVTLNRVEQRNALSLDVMRELTSRLDGRSRGHRRARGDPGRQRPGVQRRP